MDPPFFDVSACNEEQLSRLETYRSEYRSYRTGAAKGAHGEIVEQVLVNDDGGTAVAVHLLRYSAGAPPPGDREAPTCGRNT